ncbi:MAG: glycosyltransferase family 39 protein, partial [Planctomycetes bacterium]|nr:glycosyltransferase family 39 protein [Planctomycetota bacterium]
MISLEAERLFMMNPGSRFQSISSQPQRSYRWFLLLLWLVCIVRGVLYVSLNPIFEGPDETMHYAYIQELAEHRRLPVYQESRLSREIAWALKYLPTAGVDSLLPKAEKDVLTPRHENYWQRSSFELDKMQKNLSKITRIQRKKNSIIVQYEAHHPPLYYLLGAFVYRGFEDRNLIDILFAVRLLSVFLASLTVPLGFMALRAWMPGQSRLSMIVMAITVFMPVFYFDTSRVGNDSLGVPLFTGLLWVCGIFWHSDWKLKYSFGLGLLLGLGLITKAYFLAAVPPIILMILIKILQDRPALKKVLRSFLVILLCTVGIAGWWYIRNCRLYGSFTGLPELLSLKEVKPLHWIEALKEINLFRFLRRIIDTHLWPGNWSLLDLPKTTEKIFRLFLIAGLLGFVVRVFRDFFKNTEKKPFWSSCVLISFYLVFLCGMLFHSLQAWGAIGYIQTGGWFLCALIVIETVMLVQGMDFLFSGFILRWKGYLLFLLFFIGIDLFGIFYRIIPFYTG